MTHELLLLTGPEDQYAHTLGTVAAAATRAGLTVHPCTGLEDALAHLKEGITAGEAPALVMFGPGLAKPLTAAREIRRLVSAAQFVFLGDAERAAEIRRDMGLAPRIGPYWSVAPPGDEGLERAIRDAARSTSQRRQMRTTLDRANVQLSARPAADAPDYRKLVLSNQYLASILASARDAILSTDPAGKVVSWNPAAEQLFGYPEAEAVGRPLSSLVGGGDASPPDVLVEVRAGDDRGPRLVVCRRKDGSAFDGEATVAAVRDEVGRPLGFSAIVRDVTDRKRVEDEVRRQRGWLQVTLASIGDAVISTDAQGNVTFLNGVAEALTGWPQADAAGRPLPDVFRIVNEYTRKSVEDPALRALREGVIVGLANHTVLIARDGSERPIDDSAAPMRGADGTPVGAVLVFRDVTERKQAEEDQLRLAAIVESSGDAILSQTLDGIIRTWNAGAERIFGYTRQEAVGRPIAMIIPPERLDEEGEILARLRRDERIEHFETVRVARNGRRLDVSLAVSPLRNHDGVTVGASTIARDVTEAKRAEAELRSKSERLNLLVENTRDYAVVIFGLDGTVTEWQGGAERITGFPAPEAVGQKGHLIFTPEDRAAGRPEEEMRKAALDGRAEDRRWHLRKDGSRFFADGVTTALYDVGGKLRGFGKVFKDATGEELAKQSRTEHTERLKTLADVSTRLNAVLDLGSVLGVVTGEGRGLVGAHQAVTEVAQDTDDAVQSFSFSDELHAGEVVLAPPFRSAIYKAVAADNRTVRLTHDELQACIGWDTVREAAGGHPPLRGLLAAPIVGPSGETLGVIQVSDKYAGEFTEEDEAILVQLAQMAAVAIENTRLYRALRDADRKKDDFLALLAHELRNPLAPIRNGLQVIRLARDRGALERSQEMMDRQLTHMVRLIDDLLDVSRINRNKMELRRTRILLADAVNSAVETARPAIEAAGHELVLALPDEPVALDADLTRLAQVFSNLLTNSAKYTEGGGRIRLAARVDGGEAVVTVTDTGIGIPADALPHIFDMFSQVDRSIERSTGGLGIGLALVKGLVEMHGGTVSAASGGQNRGSAFTVRLPVLSNRAEEPALSEGQPVSDSGPERRILVVDDNRDSAQSMADMLTLFGNEVAVAFNGLEAVERAGTFRPDVILMDVGMPQLNGYEATRRIRAQPWGRATVIIALTGWGQEGDRALTKEAGCNGHLVKPVSLADLQKLLGELT